MTVVNVDLIDIAGFRGDGVITIASTVGRPESNGSAFVTGAPHEFRVVAGLATLTDLDPGPAAVVARMGTWHEKWMVSIPDEPTPITFTTLLDAYVEYEPSVVGQAQAARDEAVTAANTATTAATQATNAYNALTDDIENAADAVRAQVASDADRAELAAANAEDSETSASASALSASGSSTAANNSKTAAASSATAADNSKTAAASSATAAGLAKTDAEAARDAAALSASGAASSASAASSSASAASGSAGDAASALADANSARDDAQYARTQAVSAKDAAESARTTATTAASNAQSYASSASNSASSAQASANSFSLSASASTLAPGSPATATVSGTSPTYSVSFGVPAGVKGDKGDQGTGLQLSGRVSTYSLLPTGLNNTTDKGRAYIVNADGLLYIWDGTAFPADGAGLNLVGAKGDPGPQGDPGPRGYPANMAIGTVTQGATADASVTGTSPDFLLNLTLPKGDPGAPGTTSWSGITDKPSTFPPIVGTGAADAKAGDWMPSWTDVKSKPSTFAPIIGSGSTQAVAGNDARLTDTRTPTDNSVTTAKIVNANVTKAKLESTVQTSLGKADSSVQGSGLTIVTASSDPASGTPSTTITLVI